MDPKWSPRSDVGVILGDVGAACAMLGHVGDQSPPKRSAGSCSRNKDRPSTSHGARGTAADLLLLVVLL